MDSGLQPERDIQLDSWAIVFPEESRGALPPIVNSHEISWLDISKKL
jgi:hypothetical protein